VDARDAVNRSVLGEDVSEMFDFMPDSFTVL
jgi:hypothetical protein